jgi:hypothetical protein
VTTIKETNNLTTLNLTTLFEKLEEHQEELMSLEKHEKKIKKEEHTEKDKGKSKALKTNSKKSKGKEQLGGSNSDIDSNGEEMCFFCSSIQQIYQVKLQMKRKKK